MLKYLVLLSLAAQILGQCDNPPRPNHATVDCTIANGIKECSMTCLPGYQRLAGEPTTTCDLELGFWAGPLVDCEPINGPVDCPVLTPPQYGNVSCTRGESGELTCNFTCPDWTGLLGSPTTVCRDGEWTNDLPFCLVNHAKCDLPGAQCSKLTQDTYEKPDEVLTYLPEDLLEIIKQIEMEYNAERMKRGNARYKCKMEMCRIPCTLLRPRKWCNKCIRCKVNNLKCSRGGELFGR